jgi:diguanylate cyclase (GGDEF)-like protein
LLIGQVLAQEAKTSYRIAINKTSYPYHFLDQELKPQGLMVDVWKLWAKKQNVDVTFVPLNWQQTITQVKNSTVDIHAGLSKNAERESIFSFSDAFFLQNRHLFLHRSIAHIRSIKQLAPYAIGVVAGSSHEIAIKEIYPYLAVKRFPDRHAQYEAAINNEILVIAGVEKLSKNFDAYPVLNQNFPGFTRIPYHTSDYGAAVAKGSVQLLKFVQQGIDKITIEEKSAIERKWLGMDKSDNLITLSYSDKQAPFSDTSITGSAQGFFIELWRLWAQSNGLEVEFRLDQSPELNQLTQEFADIHLDNVLVFDDSPDILLGPIIYSVDYNLFLANDIERISHVSQLSQKTIGVLSNSKFIADITNNITKTEIVVFSDYRSLFKAAERGELDIIAGQRDLVENLLVKSNLQSSFSRFNAYKFTRNIHAMLNQLQPELARLIEEGFDEIPLEALVALEKKWNFDQSSGFYKRQLAMLKLTEAESLWLKDHGTIKFGVTTNWLPIEFVDKYGDFRGINLDVFELVAQRLNINAEYSAYENFDELYQALLDGDVDAIGSVMETDARKEQVLFTSSYWSMPWVIVHPRELGSQLSLENFKGKSLAIGKGFYLVSVIRKEFPTITLKLVDDNEEGLLAVQKGIVDGFIDNLSSGTELLKRESMISLGMSVLDEVDKNGNHIAINKALPMLAKVLKKAVLTISDIESQQIYEKWFDISIETGLDKNVVMRVAAQIGVLIIIIIIIIMVWNRRLYREIKNRKRLEQQMKYMATHDDLTGLANRILLKDRLNNAITFHQRQQLSIAVLFIDLDGFKNINDNYGHDVGDELLIEVASRLEGCVRESDTVVRFGGDEFVLLLTGLHHQNEAAYVAEKVLKLIQQPIELSSAVTATIGCSIGIAMYPEDGESDNDLLKVADSLMYKVKASGKNNYVFNHQTS